MTTAIYPRLPHRVLEILGVDTYQKVVDWFTAEDDPRMPAQAVMAYYNLFKADCEEAQIDQSEDTLMFMARQCYMDTLAWLVTELGGGLPDCTRGITRNAQAAKDKTTALLFSALNERGQEALNEYIDTHLGK